MSAPSAVQALCPWVIRVQRPVSLETNLSGSVPSHSLSALHLKELAKRKNVVLHRFVTAKGGQIKGVRRSHQREALVTLSRIPLHSRHKGLCHLVKVIIKRGQGKNTGYRVHFISKDLYVLHALAQQLHWHHLKDAPRHNLLRGSKNKENVTYFSLQNIY